MQVTNEYSAAAPPTLEEDEERAEFERVLETDANDEVGKVVDMYFRRPDSKPTGMM